VKRKLATKFISIVLARKRTERERSKGEWCKFPERDQAKLEIMAKKINIQEIISGSIHNTAIHRPQVIR